VAADGKGAERQALQIGEDCQMADLHRKIISMLEIQQKNLRGLKNIHIKSLMKG
jgi:hypothetical protein